MGSITPREYLAATRRGTRAQLRRVKFIPMLLRPEFDLNLMPDRPFFRRSPTRGVDWTFSKIEGRILGRAQRQEKRVERGFYMCKAREKV